jgi:hypothetical protein
MLRNALSRFKLDKKGNKAVLVDRILRHVSGPDFALFGDVGGKNMEALENDGSIHETEDVDEGAD